VTNPPNRPSRPFKAITEPATTPKPAASARPTGSVRAPRPSGAQAAFGAEEIEKQAAIRDVMQYTVRVTRAVQMAKQMVSYRSRPFVLGLISIPLLIVSLYAYAARPAWVFGPDPVRLAPARKQAYTRFAMYLAAQRIEAYRAAHGVLPGSLGEVDEEWPGVSYRPLGSRVFELSARGEAGAIVYQSDQPAPAFLGQSLAYLRSRDQ